jgi:F0F1-type ATP synthase membrane subunit b/b'
MAEIKSALELALEKAERYGKATPQEMQEVKWQEQARHLAAEFFREKIDLEPELKKFPTEAQTALGKYVKEILLRNINLPREGVADTANKRAQNGILQVSRDKKAAQRVLQEINQLFIGYEQVRQNALQQFKAQFNAQLENVRKSMEAKMQRPLNVDVENTPQFQEQWRNFEAQLNQQFEPLLDKHKAMLTTL